jgi:hypothetical protein
VTINERAQQQTIYNDPAALGKLQATTLEKLQRFEFNPRKQLEMGDDQRRAVPDRRCRRAFGLAAGRAPAR